MLGIDPNTNFVYSLEWALHSMVMPIFLLLCIRKEHVDSKGYKYEGIRIRVIFRECSCKKRGRG